MLPRALLEARPEERGGGGQGFSRVSDLKNQSKIEGDGAGKIHGILLTPCSSTLVDHLLCAWHNP